MAWVCLGLVGFGSDRFGWVWLGFLKPAAMSAIVWLSLVSLLWLGLVWNFKVGLDFGSCTSCGV